MYIETPSEPGAIVADHRQKAQAGRADVAVFGAFFLLPKEQLGGVPLQEMLRDYYVALGLLAADPVAGTHGHVVARQLQMDSDRDIEMVVVKLHRILKKLVRDVCYGVFNLVLLALDCRSNAIRREECSHIVAQEIRGQTIVTPT